MLHLVPEMMYGTEVKYQYLECSKCRCLQLINPPAEISEAYPDDYSSFTEFIYYEKSSIKNLIKKVRGNFFKLRGKIYLNSNPILKFFAGKFIDYFLPSRQPLASLKLPYFLKILDETKSNFNDKILDVGSGAGYVLVLMNQYGYTNLTGIDPFIKKDIIYNPNVRILKKEFEEVNSSFNIIFFQHSFEHMPEPSKVFEHLNLITDNNSRVIISIPLADSFAWENYKTDWVQIDAPRHYFIHTKKSIEILASNYGFYINKIEYDSNELQFWGSEQNRKGIPLKSKYSYLNGVNNSIFSKSQIKIFKKQAHELNRKGNGDQATFYLSKKI